MNTIAEQPLDFESWKEDFADHFRSFENTREISRWDIGDKLMEGESCFGKKAYEEAGQITGWKRGTLYNLVWVVAKFPTPSLRSETNLKWSHFKELAPIEDEKVREEVLRQFNDGFPHSVLDVRSRVAAVLTKLHKGPTKAKVPKTFLYLLSLDPSLRDRVKSLAGAERTTLDVLLRNIVVQYFDDHKKEVAAKIERSKTSGRSEDPS
jgi:hypothetical protein